MKLRYAPERRKDLRPTPIHNLIGRRCAFFSEAGEKIRPVIIHRAILGSVERMIAILTESYAGKWPYWLSPRQAMVVPVMPQFNDYANEVKRKLWDADVMVECDLDSNDTLNKKIRNAQLAQFNFILGTFRACSKREKKP